MIKGMNEYDGIYVVNNVRTTKQFPSFLDEVLFLFKQDADKIDSVYINMGRLFIRGYNTAGDEDELMLRLPTYSTKLVVARIAFINRRKGFMGNLYTILQKAAKEIGANEIVIECVLSDEMKNWCDKYHFHTDGMGDYTKNVN